MEAIKNYLDSMFANLPNTAEVRRAKDELWQMMEDKYGELIAEGKTENEAVGTVISEFGNLSELAEDLGLENEVKPSSDKKNDEAADNDASDKASDNETGSEAEAEKKAYEPDPEARIIPASEAEELVKVRADSSLKIALGIAICILSPLGPMLIDMLDVRSIFGGLGFGLLCTIIAGGVILIVFGALADKKYRNTWLEKCTLSMDATKYVADEKAVYMRNHNLFMTLGVMLVALSWIPSVIVSSIIPRFGNVSGAVFFMTAALGVMLIVYSGMRKNGYDNLLKLNGEGTIKASYEPEDEKNVKYISPAAEFFMSVYWPTFTCIYLILSFVTFKFALTWIIWPVCGILYRPLKRALTVRED